MSLPDKEREINRRISRAIQKFSGFRVTVNRRIISINRERLLEEIEGIRDDLNEIESYIKEQ